MVSVNRSQKANWLRTSGGRNYSKSSASFQILDGIVRRASLSQSDCLGARTIYAGKKKQWFLNKSTIGV